MQDTADLRHNLVLKKKKKKKQISYIVYEGFHGWLYILGYF